MIFWCPISWVVGVDLLFGFLILPPAKRFHSPAISICFAPFVLLASVQCVLVILPSWSGLLSLFPRRKQLLLGTFLGWVETASKWTDAESAMALGPGEVHIFLLGTMLSPVQLLHWESWTPHRSCMFDFIINLFCFHPQWHLYSQASLESEKEEFENPQDVGTFGHMLLGSERQNEVLET